MTDYYRLLGVASNATTDEIKKAYRELALKYHPDRNPGDQKTEDYFKRVTEAYVILSDPESRERYNQTYHKGRTAAPNNGGNGNSQARDGRAMQQVFLGIIKDVSEKVRKIERNRVDQPELYRSLNEILSESNVNFLLSQPDKTTNVQIAKETMKCLDSLDFQYVNQLTPVIKRLCMSDPEMLDRIDSYIRKRRFLNVLSRYWVVAIIALSLLFFGYMCNLSNAGSGSDSKGSSRRPSDGDLDETFVFTTTPSSGSTDRTNPKLKEAAEKDKLIADGWSEASLSNGQFPSCYNFTPKKSKIKNHLEVTVGGGTDVAIKVMNAKNEKCIRYVFINRKSTYRITNIPEGTYYLLIAYGKDWYSKIQDGKCIGKFARNPMYEKGQEILDFSIQRSQFGYSIPSFRLQLDVMSSRTMNTFNSKNISEDEFNK